jgi:hypothetical protein
MARTVACVLVLLGSLQPADASACADGRVRYEPRSFLGYACADDCERHKAGFAWAVQRGLTDATACRELDQEQSEGCLAWIEEGLDAEEAGYRWALENEIDAPILCAGAGGGFLSGCLRQLAARAAN